MDSALLGVFLRLAAVLALVIANGFFVAAEFALIAARPTRLQALAAEGNRLAQVTLRARRDPNRFISAAQLGITMASLALGWIGEDTLAHLLEPPLAAVPGLGSAGALVSAHALAIIGAFAAITLLHIVLGEQVPKMIALQRAEGTILFSVLPTLWIATLFRPFIAVLYWSAAFVLRLFRLQWQGEHGLVHTAEELEMMISASRRAGVLPAEEERMLHGVFDFAELSAREVMVPRTDAVTLAIDATLAQVEETLERTHHSRFPVYDGTMDNIIGMAHAKDLYRLLRRERPSPAANGRSEATSSTAFLQRADTLRPIVAVPETSRVDDVLREMRRRRTHMAVVLDEWGGMAGIVTLSDLLERIAGEVPDEFEAHEAPEFLDRPDGTALIHGLVLIRDVNERYNLHLDDTDDDTLGGYVFTQLARVAHVGDVVPADGRQLRVQEMDGLRVAKLWLGPAAPGGRTEGTRGTETAEGH